MHNEELTETVRERIETISSQQVRYIIDPRGVTKFIVKEHGKKERFTVGIGETHTCTCREKETCIHILYILMRYFSIPKDNPLLWKKNLSEREVNMIIDGRARITAPQKPKEIYRTKSGKKKVKRQPITEEDVCPICYDNLCDCDKSKIAWCRCGCGGNFHRKCVKEWINSRRAYGETATCPLCRCELDMMGINAPKKPPPPNLDAPPNLTPEEIRALMTRDLTPDDYHLLLRLDERRPAQRQKPSPNTRTNAANRIIHAHTPNQDLAITGTRGGNGAHPMDQIGGGAGFRIPRPTRITRGRLTPQGAPNFTGTVMGAAIGAEAEVHPEPHTDRPIGGRPRIIRQQHHPQNQPETRSEEQLARMPPLQSNFAGVRPAVQHTPAVHPTLPPREMAMPKPKRTEFVADVAGLTVGNGAGRAVSEVRFPLRPVRIQREHRPHPSAASFTDGPMVVGNAL